MPSVTRTMSDLGRGGGGNGKQRHLIECSPCSTGWRMRADEVMEMMKAFALAIMENAADQKRKLCFGNPRRSRNQEGGKNSLKVPPMPGAAVMSTTKQITTINTAHKHKPLHLKPDAQCEPEQREEQWLICLQRISGYDVVRPSLLGQTCPASGSMTRNHPGCRRELSASALLMQDEAQPEDP